MAKTIPLLISDYYDLLINEVDIHTEEMLQATTNPTSSIEQEFEEMEFGTDSDSYSDSNSNPDYLGSGSNSDSYSDLEYKSIEPFLYEINKHFSDLDSSDAEWNDFRKKKDFDDFEEKHEFELDLKPIINETDDVPVQTLFESNEAKCDYLNVVRRKVIDALIAARNKNLKYFDSIRSDFPRNISKLNNNEIEALRARLFANKFSFVTKIEPCKGVSKLLVFFVDFYLTQHELETLK
jgi:hypothetical protein